MVRAFSSGLGQPTESGNCVQARARPGAYSHPQERRGTMRARVAAAALLAAISLQVQADDDTFEVVTLSNRADLVSGGDALVEVRVPKGVALSRVKVTRNGTDVTA